MKKLLLIGGMLLIGAYATAQVISTAALKSADSDELSEVYLRGDMNEWAAEDAWKFQNVEGTIYKLLTPETIHPGVEFKIADANWSKINYSTVVLGMYSETEYEMYYSAYYNMGFSNAFRGVIWIDLNTDEPKFECSVYESYVPEWAEGIESGEIEWVTVNVEKPGEFAETYLTQNNYDWGSTKYLKVTGSLHATDLNAIKSVKNLRKLDLSETDITEIPDRFMDGKKTLNEIWLPSNLEKIGYEAFSSCSALKKVNLQGIKVVGERSFLNCYELISIDLAGVEAIGSTAFRYCYKLETVNPTGVKTIGSEAFYECTQLINVDLSMAEYIGSEAFYKCSSLETVDLSSVKTWKSYAFNGCSALQSAIFPNQVTNIPYYCFAQTGLTSIEIPEGVTVIDNDAFYGCRALETVSLPSSLLQIGVEVFDNCTSLSSITIPAKVKSIGRYAFQNTGIKEFKCLSVVPPALAGSIVGGDKMDMTQTYLYVPSFSKDYYRNTTYWNDFYLMRSLQEPIDYMSIQRPLTINLEEEDNDLISNKPTIEMSGSFISYGEMGELTATGEGTLSAGNFIVNSVAGMHGSHYYPGYYPTLVNYADKMRADNVIHTFNFSSNSGLWYFLSLPYDVKVADIVPSNDTYWVIRRYDSELRAKGQTGSTWVNMSADDTLEAGKGYIVSVAGGEIYGEDYYGNPQRYAPQLTFQSGNSLTKNNLFRSSDVTMTLEEHEAEYAHNRSWNFIGNPYPSYFDMHCLNEEFKAPVTVWNGSGYTAYSPVDDDLVLAPYEAFFVQCPLEANTITFKEEGRLHYSDGNSRINAPARGPKSVMAEERNVFNFIIMEDEYEDRARIVLNPEAKSEYEVGRDASKFFADKNDNAQIYVNGNTLYSIDERPVGEGEATLGLRGGEGKAYKLSLGGNHSNEWQVMLTDNETGITVDLCKEDYEFVAGASNPSRFSICFIIAGNGESGLDNILSDFGADTEVTVTSLNGMVEYKGSISEMQVSEAGLYVISNGEKSRKAILKR